MIRPLALALTLAVAGNAWAESHGSGHAVGSPHADTAASGSGLRGRFDAARTDVRRTWQGLSVRQRRIAKATGFIGFGVLYYRATAGRRAASRLRRNRTLAVYGASATLYGAAGTALQAVSNVDLWQHATALSYAPAVAAFGGAGYVLARLASRAGEPTSGVVENKAVEQEHATNFDKTYTLPAGSRVTGESGKSVDGLEPAGTLRYEGRIRGRGFAKLVLHYHGKANNQGKVFDYAVQQVLPEARSANGAVVRPRGATIVRADGTHTELEFAGIDAGKYPAEIHFRLGHDQAPKSVTFR